MDERIDSFGYWVRRQRRALDLTQGALADKVSCSSAAIKKIEAEERRPSRALAERLAEQLGIPALQRAAFVQAARHVQAVAVPALDHPAVEPTRSQAGSARPPVAMTTPLVGRAEHCAALADGLGHARAGAGQVVLLQGEAGIGKSRLIQEAGGDARRLGLAVLGANCYEIERSIAYQPVVELAAQACAALTPAQLRGMAPVLLAELAALVPALAARVPALPALSADFPEARQARLFQALAQLFEVTAAARGLLLSVDNIQWADDASLRFLHYLARRVAALPLLLLCAFRDEDLEATPELGALIASLRGDAHTRVLVLPRLSLADVGALLSAAATPLGAAPDLAARLLQESEGNPFFLWSQLHAIGEATALAAGERLPLTQEVCDSVRARLARVPGQDRALLEIAAVLGRRFHFERLLTLCGMAPPAFLGTLEALVSRRLLWQEREGGYCDFSHDKVREVVYQDTGPTRRLLLHRQVAQLLEQEGGGDAHERHGLLAEHCERGEDWTRAVHYLGLAADHSLRLFAIRESLQWLDRALALLDAHPDAATAAQRVELCERRGAARAQAGDMDGAVADFQSVIGAARAMGDPARARDVLIRLGMAYRRSDGYERAVACLDEALAAARAGGDERQVADSLYHLGTVAWSNGRNDLAIAYHQEAVEICQRLQLADLVAVQAFHGRGEAYFAQLQPAAAIDCFSRSLELARAIGDRSYESENLMMIGWACTGMLGLGEHERALSHLDAALDIARAADLQWHIGPTRIGRAHALAALGRAHESLAELEATLPELEGLRLVRYQVMAHDAAGGVLLDQDKPAEAAVHFERALLLAGSAGIRYWLAREQAGLALAQVRRGGAADRGALLSALRQVRDHQETWLVPRCLEALAEAALAAGDVKAARQHARELLALSSRGQLLALAGVARRLLERSGTPEAA